MTELSDATYQLIQKHCETGDAFASQQDFPSALAEYWSAWDLLPTPQTNWDAATWILGAIGDANFLNRDYIAGRDNLAMAMHCPGAIGNPFLHLRLGQCLFELGETDRAAGELIRAYMGAGKDIFEGESKYFDFLKTRISPPASGVW